MTVATESCQCSKGRCVIVLMFRHHVSGGPYNMSTVSSQQERWSCKSDNNQQQGEDIKIKNPGPGYGHLLISLLPRFSGDYKDTISILLVHLQQGHKLLKTCRWLRSDRLTYCGLLLEAAVDELFLLLELVAELLLGPLLLLLQEPELPQLLAPAAAQAEGKTEGSVVKK